MRKGARVIGLVAASVLFAWLARAYVSGAAPHVDPDDPCTLLNADDFAEAGLAGGAPTPESSPAGRGCAWSPVLGKGGAVRLQMLSVDIYGRRKALDARALTPVPDLGDEGFAIAGMSGEQLYVRKGTRAFRIDGDGQFDRAALRPLARVIASRL